MTDVLNNNPTVKDARKLCQKYDKDVIIIIFLEKDPITKQYNSKAKYGVCVYGSDPDNTAVGEWLGNSVMTHIDFQVKQLITRLANKIGKIIIPTKDQEQKTIKNAQIIELFNKSGNGNKKP